MQTIWDISSQFPLIYCISFLYSCIHLSTWNFIFLSEHQNCSSGWCISSVVYKPSPGVNTHPYSCDIQGLCKKNKLEDNQCANVSVHLWIIPFGIYSTCKGSALRDHVYVEWFCEKNDVFLPTEPRLKISLILVAWTGHSAVVFWN